MTWKSGIDIIVENLVHNENGEIDLELNVGESKCYSGGPKCIFREQKLIVLLLHLKVVESLAAYL